MASARSHLGLRLRNLGTINTAYFFFVIDVCCATWSDLALAPQTQFPLARLVAAYPAPGSRRHSFTKGAVVLPEGILRRSVGNSYRRAMEFLRGELAYRATAEKLAISGRNGHGKSYLWGPKLSLASDAMMRNVYGNAPFQMQKRMFHACGGSSLYWSHEHRGAFAPDCGHQLCQEGRSVWRTLFAFLHPLAKRNAT